MKIILLGFVIPLIVDVLLAILHMIWTIIIYAYLVTLLLPIVRLATILPLILFALHAILLFHSIRRQINVNFAHHVLLDAGHAILRITFVILVNGAITTITPLFYANDVIRQCPIVIDAITIHHVHIAIHIMGLAPIILAHYVILT
jgi:hypothetical protein